MRVLSALEDHGYHTKDSPAQGSTLEETASHSLDRLMVSADDGNAVSDAGLLVAASLGQHLVDRTSVGHRAGTGRGEHPAIGHDCGGGVRGRPCFGTGRMPQSAMAAATCPSTMLETAPLPPKMKAASIVARFSARNA